MTSFVKNNMKLISQGVTGFKIWHYSDTGVITDIVDTAGYFTLAKQMGVDTGDLVMISASDGTATKSIRSAGFSIVQDTGETTGTVGPATMIGDTG
jgi:hypothetical protein